MIVSEGGDVMVIAEHQAKLTDIRDLINQVPSYPISVKRLLDLAGRKRVDREVISFYRAFPDNVVFEDKDDLDAKTEAVQLMQSENPPAEDEIRGAED
jgi:hypothetical protein